jgi:transposase-like protein
MEANRGEQRWNLVMALQTGQSSMTELCERYGVTRPTGYKWLGRADEGETATAIHGLCPLNVWWMQLGIVHQRIHPGSPRENGQHERIPQPNSVPRGRRSRSRG